jgi:hypothetical protein
VFTYRSELCVVLSAKPLKALPQTDCGSLGSLQTRICILYLITSQSDTAL